MRTAGTCAGFVLCTAEPTPDLLTSDRQQALEMIAQTAGRQERPSLRVE